MKWFGNVYYVLCKLKYVVLYCDMVEVEDIFNKVFCFYYVKCVEMFFCLFLKIEYEFKKEMMYEYKNEDV